jgi:hypothetical protein
LTAALLFSRTIEPSPWGEAVRIFRRIALLRASGRGAEAEAIAEQELPAALETARASEPSAEAADRRQATLYSLEEERMIQAASTAELLAPMLVERLRGIPPFPPGGHPDHAGRPAASQDGPAPGRGARTASKPPEIADMIDGMLAIEIAERRSRKSPVR